MKDNIDNFNKNRTAGSHKFKDNGECQYCRDNIYTAKFKMCRIITPDEVKQFRIDES